MNPNDPSPPVYPTYICQHILSYGALHRNHHYNRSLQPYARQLRHNMTKAEACLWKYVLRNRQLGGFAFRRQRPLLHYIADFLCFDLQLSIEVDGISHEWAETVDKDRRKDEALSAAGFTVLRFTDAEVLRNLAVVVQQLESWIARNWRGGKKESTG